jgi:serine/threonine-protein kinase
MARKSTTLRYEVLNKMGEGSLFTVYCVRDHLLNQTVALKAIRPEVARHARLAQLIRRSAEIATRLPHGNAARVLSIGEDEGTTFIVTEFVPGENLETKCKKRAPLPYREAVRITLQIAEVLHYAHQNGIVHGNLHPRNVIVTPKGQVKVTDFALAEAYRSPAMAQAGDSSYAIPYLSPERINGHDPAPADDLYALGMMLHLMLAGRLPLADESEAPAPVRAYNPNVPAALERIVLRLLAGEEERYQSAGPLIRDLRRVESGVSETPQDDEVPVSVKAKPAQRRPQRAQRRGARGEEDNASRLNSILWTLAALLALLVVVMVGWFLFYLNQGPPEVRVPEIEGKTLEQARQMLQERGLTLSEKRVFSDKVPLDIVINTEPEPGRKVKQGRVIQATISNGAELVRVPDIMGMAVEAAKRLLTEQGFKIGKVEQQHHEIAARGEVIAQSVRAGESVPKGTEMSLVVSQGPKPEPLPGSDGTVQPPVFDGTMVEGVVNIRLTVPQGASQQEVKIVVRDMLGEHTAYQQYHAPGDAIEQDINIVVASNQKALIRVYVAGRLVKERPVAPNELANSQ